MPPGGTSALVTLSSGTADPTREVFVPAVEDPTMTVEVRPATTDDVAGIRRVAHAGWEAAYGDVLSSSTRQRCLSEWYSHEAIERIVADDDVGYFVAEDDGVVGYASGDLTDSDSVGRLSSIYVHPDRWRDGVGSRLLDTVEEYLAERGAREIRVLVLAENDVGIDFYRSRGYDCDETRTAELGDGSHREHVFRGRL